MSEPLKAGLTLTFLRRSALLNILFALESSSNFILDIMVAAAIGLSARSDVLYAAWLVPQAIGRGVFQSLTNSLLGLFSDESEFASASQQAITVVGITSALAAALLSLSSSVWLPSILLGADAEVRQQAVPLARVLSWLICFLAMAETLRAIYYHYGNWWWPTVARISGGALAAGAILYSGQIDNLAVAAWGITSGAVLEAALGMVGMFWIVGLGYKSRWPSRDRLKELRLLVGAPLAGQGIRALAGAALLAIGSLLGPGAVTLVAYSSRIVQSIERTLFRGFVIATIRSFGQAREIDLRQQYRAIGLIAIPVAVMLATLSFPLAAVVFNRGRFGASDVQLLGITLQIYALAIPAIALTRIPFGLAYARKRMDVVFGFFAVVSVILVLGTWLAVRLGLGLRSFGLAHALAIWVALAVSMRRLSQPAKTMFSRSDAGRLAVVGLLTFAATAGFNFLVGANSTGALDRAWLALAGGIVACGLAFLIASYALMKDDFRQFSRLIRVWQR